MNLLDLVLRLNLTPPPRKVAGTHGGEWHGPCPVCGGKDRFHFWPERPSTGSCSVPGVWGCRVCDTSGDAIAFLQFSERLGFKEACARLGMKLESQEYRPARMPRPQEEKQRLEVAEPGLPNPTWRERCGKLVDAAHEILLTSPEPLAWLAARGLDEESVRRFRLGCLPGEQLPAKKGGGLSSWYVRPLKAWGLPDEEKNGRPVKVFRFPRGLVIPRFHPGTGEVVSLRIRRTAADMKESLPHLKYQAFKGAKVRPLLLLPGFAQDIAGLAVVESELDAMLLAEVARRSGVICGAVGLVSNTARPDPDTDEACRKASRLLLALDFDPEGSGGKAYTDKAVAKWMATYPRARDWPLPKGKDPGEAFQAGVDLALWLKAGLPPMCWEASSAAPGGKKGPQEPGAVSGSPAGALATGVQAIQGQGAGGEIPPNVLALQRLMWRFNLQVRVNETVITNGRERPVALGLVFSSNFQRNHWQHLQEFGRLVFHCPEVLNWLDTHPVQSGRITAENLLKRS